MKIIYWNTKQHQDFSTIQEIIVEQNPDILFLSEISENIIIKNYSILKSIQYEHFENPGCSRVLIIKKKSVNLVLSRQNNYYTTVKELKTNTFIISVHLPSQMYQSIDALKSFIREIRNEIDIYIGSSSQKDILIIGDFNMNPYEKPMIDFDGFAASNSKKLKKEVTHLKTKKELYYNPTWTLYSNNSFPGTKYYKRPSTTSFDILEHHYLDQVVLSYSLSQKLISETINVLKNTKNKFFFDLISNTIKLSDHLPIIYEYKI